MVTYVYTHVMYTGVMFTCVMYTNVMYTGVIKKVKVSSYIVQYPILSYFYTLLPGRPVQSRNISASLGSIQPRGNFAKPVRKYSSLPIASYSFIQLSELEQC